MQRIDPAANRDQRKGSRANRKAEEGEAMQSGKGQLGRKAIFVAALVALTLGSGVAATPAAAEGYSYPGRHGDHHPGKGQAYGHHPGKGQAYGHHPGKGQAYGHHPGKGQAYGHHPGKGQAYGHHPGKGQAYGHHPGKGRAYGHHPGKGRAYGHHPGKGHGYGHLLGYVLGLGNHTRRPHYAYDGYRPHKRSCHRVTKVEYARHGRKAKIGGTMCYDRHGNPYIVAGSRYVIHYY
jgi:hypothetical protein